MRIRFPAPLDADVVSDLHTPQLHTSSKAELLTDEHREALLSETQIGFVDDLQSPGGSSLQQPISASSESHYGGRVAIFALTLLRDATAPPLPVQEDASKDTAPPKTAVAGQVQAENAAPGSKTNIVDMRTKIDNPAAGFKKTMKGQLAKIQKKRKVQHRMCQGSFTLCMGKSFLPAGGATHSMHAVVAWKPASCDS